MSIRYHDHATLAAAEAKLAALRAAGGIAYMLTMNASHYQVRELYAVNAAPSAVDAHIGSLAEATLEPLSDAPASDGSHVTLDARNVDHWSRNHDR